MKRPSPLSIVWCGWLACNYHVVDVITFVTKVMMFDEHVYWIYLSYELLQIFSCYSTRLDYGVW